MLDLRLLVEGRGAAAVSLQLCGLVVQLGSFEVMLFDGFAQGLDVGLGLCKLGLCLLMLPGRLLPLLPDAAELIEEIPEPGTFGVQLLLVLLGIGQRDLQLGLADRGGIQLGMELVQGLLQPGTVCFAGGLVVGDGPDLTGQLLLSGPELLQGRAQGGMLLLPPVPGPAGPDGQRSDRR